MKKKIYFSKLNNSIFMKKSTIGKSIFLSLAISLSSCASKKDIIYFQSKNNSVNSIANYANENIKANDILNISVSALDITSITPFLKEKLMSKDMNQSLIDGYTVNSDGKINLPLIGNVKVSGQTTNQASETIQNLLSKSIIDPIVNIRLLNYKVTVLGEVNQPGTFNIYDPKITIIQALGLAGDITIYGKKNKIKLTREINGNSITTHIDLTNANFFSSDFYYLRKNDVIYVEPTFAKIKNSGYIGQISNVATVFSLIMSIIILSNNTN